MGRLLSSLHSSTVMRIAVMLFALVAIFLTASWTLEGRVLRQDEPKLDTAETVPAADKWDLRPESDGKQISSPDDIFGAEDPTTDEKKAGEGKEKKPEKGEKGGNNQINSPEDIFGSGDEDDTASATLIVVPTSTRKAASQQQATSSTAAETGDKPVPKPAEQPSQWTDGDDASAVENPWHPQPSDCPHYSTYSTKAHEPLSEGRRKLPYMRPSATCRTFNASSAESTIKRVSGAIADPDLARLFENTFPNTLDTAIKWHGTAANNSAEELTFVITGDIDAMWLRDSADQLQAYRGLLADAKSDVAPLFRGAINLQARYVNLAPYCNAFQPPPEAGIATGLGGGGSSVSPAFDPAVVSTCNFELDSFGALLQLSADYYNATGDAAFFGRFQWVPAVQTMLRTARDMMAPTVDPDDGHRLDAPYRFNSQTNTMTGTLGNQGIGNPVRRTGMIRSPFRPSDDTSVFEFLVPSNMMFARYLEAAAEIASQLGPDAAPADLAGEMVEMATGLRKAIAEHAVVEGPSGKKMYAFEVDGFGGRNLMDDANVPSLLSAPFLGFVDRDDPVYRNTREFVLSDKNPWFCRGPFINAVGSPHIKAGAAWPMASIMRILTSDDDDEIVKSLRELVNSTGELGLMHESVNSHDDKDWTRQWFSWSNGLFGQMILDLEQRKPHILTTSFQELPTVSLADIIPDTNKSD